ncbi:MAG: glycosyltransferase family 2 protein [Myxococcales bacterium]|nr:glycosyltransferase family 2 protein [Myxococcales bacterium]
MQWSLSIVMFAYNEAENVGPCMREALDFLRENTVDYELILVDDGSSDGTADAARVVQDEQPNHVQVVSYSPNRGIGGALKAGFEVARKEWVTLLPADGQVPPSGLKNLMEVVESDPSVEFVTCHFPHRFKEADNLKRKALSRGLRVVMWLLTGISRKLDGVYLIRNTDLQAATKRSDSFFLNFELPIRVIHAGVKDGATTMHIRPRRAGESKVANGRKVFKVLQDLGKLGLELRTGVVLK